MRKRSPQAQDDYAAFETALEAAESQQYVLRLYVTGATPRSLRAIQSIKQLCEEHLQGRYQLQVIDIYQQPTLAKGDQIVAVPTLIKQLPSPIRKFIGDMASVDRILLGLDLRTTPKKSKRA